MPDFRPSEALRYGPSAADSRSSAGQRRAAQGSAGQRRAAQGSAGQRRAAQGSATRPTPSRACAHSDDPASDVGGTIGGENKSAMAILSPLSHGLTPVVRTRILPS
jgi:hypothetical protein